MIWYLIPYLITSAGFSAFIWLLYKDREYWRTKYDAKDQSAREREEKLYDQLLKVKGFRMMGEALTPQVSERQSPILSDESIDVMSDRIQERVEHGLITPSEALDLVHEMRTGQKSQAEIDRILRQRQLQSLTGSVADIVG